MSELSLIREQIKQLELEHRRLERKERAYFSQRDAARLAELNDKLAELRREEVRLLDGDTVATRQHELAQRSFWFQRLNTSLAIAHGAGFAAVASHLFDPNTTAASAGLSLPAMTTFGLGALVAGAIPLPLAYEKRPVATWLMAIAAGLFVMAVGLATYGAGLKAFGHVWIWQP